jgi:thioredoxin-dependent peroxiredoxin
MKRMMFKLALVCVAGLAMAAAARPPSPNALPEELKVGDPAPPFSLPGSDGKTHSLADYRGKTVVLAWFPKAFTGG